MIDTETERHFSAGVPRIKYVTMTHKGEAFRIRYETFVVDGKEFETPEMMERNISRLRKAYRDKHKLTLVGE